MAKMKKEELEKMKRENPAENNWEISDQDSGVRGQENEEVQEQGTRNKEQAAGTALVSENPESAAKADGAAENPDFDVISNGNEVYEKPYIVPAELIEVFSGIPADLPDRGQLKKRIHQDWLKVDPAIRVRNAVWKFSIKDDNMMRCTVFLFRSGQKVRIFSPVEVVNPEFK